MLQFTSSSELIGSTQKALNTTVLRGLQAGEARDQINTVLQKREIASWRYYKIHMEV